MEFATSLTTGRTYEAFKVSYSQVKTLKLLCPVCKEKVFKRVRRIPHETHMFAHHKGGSPDCELYFPASFDRSLTTTGFSVSRGQTFEQFIRDIDADLRNLLITAQIIPERGIDERVLRLIAALVAKEARNLIPSFRVVESTLETVLNNLNEPFGYQHERKLAALIFEFYTKDRARFIDSLFYQWLLYCIYLKDDKADINFLLKRLIQDHPSVKNFFSVFAGTMLGGLTLLYSDINIKKFVHPAIPPFGESLNEQINFIARTAAIKAPSGLTLEISTRRTRGVFSDHPSAPEMILLPFGKFVMGSQKGNESPQHTVQIPYALAVGKYPITFDQWDACVRDGGTRYKPNDEGWGRGNRPVINVSWDDIQPYLRWLRKVTGKTYRLLSEAEWEYAARVGRRNAYSYGSSQNKLDRYAWFSENSGKNTHPVGEKLPNGFGLYDMHGNVWEWTEDCYNQNYSGAPTDGSAWTTGDCSQRVLRGGSWLNFPEYLSSAYRSKQPASNRYFTYGFRVARAD
jgi:formylglycine-generating enzyme required for sulfatase activity